MEDGELIEMISTGTDEQLTSLYFYYDSELTKLLNSDDSTESEINLVADTVIMLSTLTDTTVNQSMELNSEYVRKRK